MSKKVVRRKVRELLVAVLHVALMTVLFWSMIADRRLVCCILVSMICFLAFVVGKKIYHKVKLENLEFIQFAALVGAEGAVVMLDIMQPKYSLENFAIIITAYFTLFATIRIMLLIKSN